MTKMQELKALIDDCDAKVKAAGKEAVASDLKAIFDAHPELLGIRWTQYTPYFNDGDACVFSVREMFHRTEGMASDAGDYEDGFEGLPWAKEKRTPMHEAIGAFEGALVKEVALAAFGDHCQVTATRDGVTVEEYSHD